MNGKKDRSLQATNQLYGNCSVVHPDGSLMFRCSEERINWYLDRNLAKVISDDGKTIQLSFMPKGRGHDLDPFYLSKKDNHCVVCGEKEDLTRHHVVPRCYRRYFPDRIKNRNSHDVLLVCIPCHEEYEREASRLKRELAIKYNVPINGGGRNSDQPSKDYGRAKRSAAALVRNGDAIPLERQAVLKGRISKYLKKEASWTDIKRLADLPSKRRNVAAKVYGGGNGSFSHGRAVVEKIEDFNEFIIMWRQHFVDAMQPQFLNPHWDVNRKVVTSWESRKGGVIKALVITLIARFDGWNPFQKLKRLFWGSQKSADTNTNQDI